MPPWLRALFRRAPRQTTAYPGREPMDRVAVMPLPDLDTALPLRAMALPPYVPPPRVGPPSLYPDATRTPGVVFPQITEADVRVPGYAGRVRAVSDATKRAVFERYGLDPAKHVETEVDHFVSLCLGGSNDLANLWPEPAVTPDAPGQIGFRQKDAVEAYLYAQVCSGAMTLKAAQDAIRGDWYKVWRDEMPHTVKAMMLSPDAPEQP